MYMKNYYEILGIEKTATADEIKKAYRSLAFKYHPDRNPGDTVAEEKFKEISAAYDVLGDETKRRNYDLTGQTESYQNTGYNYNTYRNSSYSYGGNPFTDEDTFWQWFTGAQQAQSNGESQQYQNHNARHYYYREQKPENYSKSEYISMVVLKGLQTFLAFSFFRFSLLIFFPLGPVLCVILFVNGVRGVITGLRGLFKKKA